MDILAEVAENDQNRSQVEQLKDFTISLKSKEVYRGYQRRFLVWLNDHHNEDVHVEYRKQPEEDERRYVARVNKLIINRKSDVPPFDMDSIKVDTFMDFVIYVRDNEKKRDGSYKGFGSFNTLRSAFNEMRRFYGKPLDSDESSKLDSLFKGLKNFLNKEMVDSGKSLKKGKEDLKFSLFQSISRACLQVGDTVSLFCHLFGIMCWNLTAHASNVAAIRFGHMEWREDALGVYFAHMKTDQGGDKPRDARHIYANPVIPEICPILSLGLYLLTNPEIASNEKDLLFPGSSQYDRYRKHLLEEIGNQKEIREGGLDSKSFGTHSFRKGASTYVASGGPEAPPICAISIRAGWTMGAVRETYLRYEAAGDHFVGRTVSGLPRQSHQFATLPPFFPTRDESTCNLVEKALAVAFPNVSKHLMRTCEFCLASIIYHYDFLKETIPKESPVWETQLFSHHELIDQLKPLIACRVANDEDPIQGTGIPSYVFNKQLQQELKEMRDEIVTLRETIPDTTIEGVTKVVNTKFILFSTQSYYSFLRREQLD